MLTKPLLLQNNIIFDATKDYKFKFNVIGGDQVFKNELKIQDVETNNTVYQKIIESFQLQHLIYKNKLKNKVEYKAQIRTYNINGDKSDWSDYCIIRCFFTPTVSITNLEKDTGGRVIIRNQTYDFKGEILTDGDVLQSYKFFLYDRDQILIDKSPNIFDKKLEYQFTGLDNETKYYIELKVLTQNNVEATTGLVEFTPVYIKPRTKSAIDLINDYENAQIKIETNVIQILFRILDGTISYEDSEWINLNKGSIIAEDRDGFDVKGNWSLKMYVKDLKDDKPFVTLYDENDGYIEFVMYNDRIHIWKTQDGIFYHVISQKLNIQDKDEPIVIFATKQGEWMSIEAEKVTWQIGC
ncbi:hypothetical protein FDF96_04640 [Clostridium botulinum]|nr:hypothetical protein [Clostridium botulinum]